MTKEGTIAPFVLLALAGAPWLGRVAGWVVATMTLVPPNVLMRMLTMMMILLGLVLMVHKGTTRHGFLHSFGTSRMDLIRSR